MCFMREEMSQEFNIYSKITGVKMEQIGVVISSNGSGANVRCQVKSGCSGCEGCKSLCSTSTIVINAENSIDAKIGDKVCVTIEKSSYNKMIYRAWLIPTISLIVGILIGVYILKNELLAILIGFAACFLTYFVYGRFFKNADFEYKLIKIIK